MIYSEKGTSYNEMIDFDGDMARNNIKRDDT